MDAGSAISRTSRAARGAWTLLAVSMAMIPLALMNAATGEAEDVPPATRFAVGSVGMTTAQEIARAHWGVDPCGGQVSVTWGVDEASINARSFWANPYSAYDHPELNIQCRIVFNAEMTYSWPKFCTVLVHEYGHLAGRPHGPDGPDVMSPVYRAPLPACTADEPGSRAEPAGPSPAVRSTVVDAPLLRPAARRDARVAQQARARRARARTTVRHRRTAARAKARARARQASAPLLRFSSDAHGH